MLPPWGSCRLRRLRGLMGPLASAPSVSLLRNDPPPPNRAARWGRIWSPAVSPTLSGEDFQQHVADPQGAGPEGGREDGDEGEAGDGACALGLTSAHAGPCGVA